MASGILVREGFVGRPSWEERAAAISPPPLSADPGEWQHGWQYYASSASEHFGRPQCSPDHTPAARLTCGHSGPGVAAVFHGSPTGPEFQVQPMHFRTLVLERLRLPLLLTEARCECGGQTFTEDTEPLVQSGRLKRRAVPTERTLARVCLEAGATVTRNVKNAGHERASLSNG